MDGTSRTIIHSSGLTWPNGITLDHVTQVLYWIDGSHDRIESSNVDGSNRTVIASSSIYRPFNIALFRDTLYFTDRQTGINSVPKAGGSVVTIYNNLCDITLGIEVIAEERQPTGTIYWSIYRSPLASWMQSLQYVMFSMTLYTPGNNPCRVNNGGCSHLCLLSATDSRGYACACHIGFTLNSDQTTCSSGIEE